jgi:hypothetical protein
MRLRYVIWRLAKDLGGLFSRALNAFVFGGSTAMSTSVRAHMEAGQCHRWARRRAFINRLFWWETDHCAEEWEAEVARARYVLSRLEGMK